MSLIGNSLDYDPEAIQSLINEGYRKAMSENKSRVHDDALKGLPGDLIEHWSASDRTEKKWSTVKSTGWTYVNGGRVFTYETTENELVANDLVTDLKPHLRKEPMQVEKPKSSKSFTPIVDNQTIAHLVNEHESLDMSMKVAIHCVLCDDIENLKIAESLIRRRIREHEDIIQSLVEAQAHDAEMDS